MRALLLLAVLLATFTPAAAGVWDQTISTQAEMIPPATVRFDDIGTRATIDEDSGHFLRRGLKVSYSINALNAGDVSDSLTIRNIIAIAWQYGALENIEWLQHTNTNINPNGTSGTTLNFSDYYDYTWSRWVDELKKDPIVRIVNNCANDLGAPYQITKADIVGIVWPGDGDDVTSPSRINFIRRNPDLFHALMDTLGFEYASDAISSSSDYKRTPQMTSGATFANTIVPLPFMLYGDFANRHAISVPGTSDLGNTIVERGETAKVPWSPAGTVEWTLAQNTNYFQNAYAGAGLDDYREGTVSNFKRTWRWRYTAATSAGGGIGVVLHDEAATNGLTYSLTYPDAGGNNSLVSATTVNGGPNTFGEPIDFEYIAASLAQLVEEGFFTPATWTEAITWWASKPGDTVLKINGTDQMRFAWEAIGDTVGVTPPSWIEGFGTSAFSSAVAYTGTSNTHFRHGASHQIADDDYDGKFESMEFVSDTGWTTDPVQRMYRVEGLGHPTKGGDSAALLLFDGGGWSPTIYLNYPELLPGEYQLTVKVQSAANVRFAASPTLHLYGYGSTGRTAASYGVQDYTLVTFAERTLGPPNSTSFAGTDQSLTGGGEIGTTAFGNDTWPGAAPVTRSQAGWYTLSLSFRVPANVQVDAAYAPTTDYDDATMSRVRGSVYAPVAFLAEDFTGGYGLEEHPRVSSVALYWIGPLAP